MRCHIHAFTQVGPSELKCDENAQDGGTQSIQPDAQPEVESHPPSPDVSNDRLASEPASATAQVCSHGPWVVDDIWCDCLFDVTYNTCTHIVYVSQDVLYIATYAYSLAKQQHI